MTIKNTILNIFSDVQRSDTNKEKEFYNKLKQEKSIVDFLSENLFTVLWNSLSKNSINNKLLTWMELIEQGGGTSVSELVNQNDDLFEKIDKILNSPLRLHLTKECSWLWQFKNFYTSSTQLEYRFKIFDSMKFDWKKFYRIDSTDEEFESDDKVITSIIKKFLLLPDNDKWKIFIAKNNVLPDGVSGKNFVSSTSSALTIYKIVEILTEILGVDSDQEKEDELNKRKLIVNKKAEKTKFNKKELDKLSLEDKETLLTVENKPELVNMIKNTL